MDKKNKLREYAKLHFNMISWKGYLAAALSGVLAALMLSYFNHTSDNLSQGIIIAVSWVVILTVAGFVMPYIDKICSVMLYQKEAYFYMSFPVTAFHTVLVKTLSSATLIAVIPAAFLITGSILMGRGSVIYVISITVLCLSISILIAGIILMGYKIGNNFRSQKRQKPNKIISYIFILIATVILFYIWKAINRIPSFGMEMKVFITAGILLLLGIIIFAANINSLKKNYEI